MAHDLISRIEAMFERHGAERYESGTCDSVSQLEHALQCAALAEAAGAEAPLITAALLHDVGHLLDGVRGDEAVRGIDDGHERLGVLFLRAAFPAAVLEPIRLHVDAKRYLCAVEPGYYDALSPGSKLSLGLQGGFFNAADAATFLAQPYAREAALLRRWDDGAKVHGVTTPSLAHFARTARMCLTASA
jgi:phosphonate degradation associated HDIG domain protein